MYFICSPASTETRVKRKALAYLDKFLGSSRNHSYVLDSPQNGLHPGVIHAVCSKRPCLLSASLSRPLSDRVHHIRVAKDLLPMVLNSPGAVELPEHPLSCAVDADPKTYFESKQGSRPVATVLNSG